MESTRAWSQMSENREEEIARLREMPADEVMSSLKTSSAGITDAEAASRRSTYGPNLIPEKEKTLLQKIARYFWGPIPWMIEAAMVVSALISHWSDFAIVSVLLFTNAIIGFWQERRAENAIKQLKKSLAPRAKVLRDGKWQTMEAAELVPGDLVRVRLGDIVPADLKLVAGEYLTVDESALTGESLPVDKKIGDLAFSGSVVHTGEMNGVVFASGAGTYFGAIAGLVQEEGKSHFQKAVTRIGDFLIALSLVMIAVIVLLSIYRGEDLGATLQFSLVLLVAAIPAALPVVLAVTMAVGALALSKMGAIVSRLVSIEDLAGMNILCSDKTGTITENHLEVAEVVPLNGASPSEVLEGALMASREEDMDPIDLAILRYAEANKGRRPSYQVMQFTPFDPVSKRAVALVNREETTVKAAKGAPQSILDMVEKDDGTAARMDEIALSFAKKGYRSIGIASGPEGHVRYIGIIGLHDPPRSDSKDAIAGAKALGIEVDMVTGDHLAIAKEISAQVGLGTNMITGSELEHATPEQIAAADGFAQVFPEQKFDIVKGLQERGYVVGMTGDGVNDAPALRKADVGIAVSGASDAARAAASIVFTRPGLMTIVHAVKEGRKIFQRMNNYATYRIAESIRVILFISLSIIVFQFYPVTALMIVLLAILNDLPIITIAYDNVKPSESPDTWDMHKLLTISSFLGIFGVITSFLLLDIAITVMHIPTEQLQGLLYLKLSVAGHFTVFAARTRSHFWSVMPARSLLLAVVITQTVATLIVVYGVFMPAIGWELAAFVWTFALLGFLLADEGKTLLYCFMSKRTKKKAEAREDKAAAA